MNFGVPIRETDTEPWCLLNLGGKSGPQLQCLISQCDWTFVTQWHWNYAWKRAWYRDVLYARRNVGVNRTTIHLHRVLMHLTDPRSPRYERTHVCDHINGQTLDNRRCNLRWATIRQNNMNRHPCPPTLEEIMARLPQPVLLDDMPF